MATPTYNANLQHTNSSFYHPSNAIHNPLSPAYNMQTPMNNNNYYNYSYHNKVPQTPVIGIGTNNSSFYQNTLNRNPSTINNLNINSTNVNNSNNSKLTNLLNSNSNPNQVTNNFLGLNPSSNNSVNRTPGYTYNSKSGDVEYSSTDMNSNSRLALENITVADACAPKLQNIVSTVNLKCALELRDIALKAKNAEYNPKRFAAVIMRIREPKTTALIFASGKMVCTGARSEEDSRKASRNYAKIIQKLGYNVKFAEFKIQNIVGSCDVRFPIRLEGLASTHSKFCSYEPEMFPGLIYKMAQPKIVLLIFVSGKIVLTGAKERSDIFHAYQKIYPVLLGFRKKDNPIPSMIEGGSININNINSNNNINLSNKTTNDNEDKTKKDEK